MNQQDPLPDDSDARFEEHAFAQLVHRARDGDELAISQLIERWRSYLLFIANESLDQDLHAKIAPSDIVQQSLLDAQKHLGSFRGSSEPEFQGWVRQILRNNVLSARRSYKTAKRRDLGREICINDSNNQPLPILDRQDSTSTEALKNERAQILSAAMQKLPEHYQQIIKLRNWDELTFVEIAKRLDSSEDSTRKLWARALDRLQQVIDQNYPGFESGQFERRD